MRSRKESRAAGVTRSMGGGRPSMEQCLCCGRRLPRDAIAHIGRKPVTLKSGKVVPRAFCGQCFHSGDYLWKEWVVE